MTIILDDEYLTVAEAAALLKVNKSTVRRWIDQGSLPAYRLGQRRLALKRTDVARLITPLDRPEKMGGAAAQDQCTPLEPLTPEERERGLAAVERARRLQAEMLAKRGGQLFSPSWEILAELRDERSRELP